MALLRREFLAVAGAAALSPRALLSVINRRAGATDMFGLIGKMSAVAGQRDALAAILLEGTDAMPGCLSYIIGRSSPASVCRSAATDCSSAAELAHSQRG